jgi:phosphatidylinositol kinase/protein kinase (PI-3  family)
LIVPYKIDNNNNNYLYKNAQIMYKYEDMRKDRIITDIIRLIDLILKENELDMDIVKYHVIPITNKRGLVEIVNDSKTVFDIIENRKTSVLNYILDNNSEDTVDNIKQRFIRSTGVYCIITYLLGIGDRHLDNIMITQKGLLFHIDFTFLLGNDPKLYAPIIRIIPDMMEVIGGVNSYNYLLFKNICNKCYNIIRQHTNIISNLLSLLPVDEFDRNKLEKEIINRFNPGEMEQETDIYLNTTIENSKDSYNKYIDLMYYYNKKKNITTFLDYTKSIFNI